MGTALSRIRGTLMTRPAQRWNVETRAEKVISRDKPTPAPKYQSDVDFLENLRRTNPAIAEAATKKDDQLLGRLKEVYVRSRDPEEFDPDSVRQPENPNRPLPQKQDPALRHTFQNKHIFEATDLKPKPGKISLTVAQDILAKKAVDPGKYTAAFFSEKYELKESQVEDVLRHFSVFTLVHTGDETSLANAKDPLLPQPSWELAPPPESQGVAAIPAKNPTTKQ